MHLLRLVIVVKAYCQTKASRQLTSGTGSLLVERMGSVVKFVIPDLEESIEGSQSTMTVLDSPKWSTSAH